MNGLPVVRKANRKGELMMNAQERWAESLKNRRPDATELIRHTGDKIRRENDVQPLDDSRAAQVREKTLLDVYATSDEIASVRAAHEQIAATEKVVTMITTALTAVIGQIAAAQRSTALDTARAAAMALGEPVDPLPSRSGPSLTHLQAQKIGLQDRAEAARAAVADCKGKFRTAVFDLVRQCAVRCAQDFYELSRQQAWCFQQLAIAQSLTGGPVHHLVDPMTWNKYLIPGSEHVEVLKRNSRVEFGHLVLMSADGLRASASPALKALQAHGEALFGDWPL